MTSSLTTGGYVEAWCTKCKLKLGHTIIAMVENSPKRVKCNTCNGEHNYRNTSSDKAKTKSDKVVRQSISQRKNTYDYTSRLAGRDISNAKKYSFNGNFTKDEIIEHPQFGIGIVLTEIQTNKIDVLFENGTKLLVHNQK